MLFRLEHVFHAEPHTLRLNMLSLCLEHVFHAEPRTLRLNMLYCRSELRPFRITSGDITQSIHTYRAESC